MPRPSTSRPRRLNTYRYTSDVFVLRTALGPCTSDKRHPVHDPAIHGHAPHVEPCTQRRRPHTRDLQSPRKAGATLHIVSPSPSSTPAVRSWWVRAPLLRHAYRRRRCAVLTAATMLCTRCHPGRHGNGLSPKRPPRSGRVGRRSPLCHPRCITVRRQRRPSAQGWSSPSSSPRGPSAGRPP